MVLVHEVSLMATYSATPNLVLNKPTNKDSQSCWKFKKQKQKLKKQGWDWGCRTELSL